MSCLRFALTATIVLATFHAVATCSRAAWVETFTGGFDQPWSFIDDTGDPLPGESTALVVDNHLEIRHAGGALDNFVAGFVGPAGDPAATFEDVRVRGTVTAPDNIGTLGGGTARSNNFSFLTARGTLVPGGSASAYVFGIDYTDGTAAVFRNDNGTPDGDTLTFTGIVGFDAATPYVLELKAVGSAISGDVFEVGGSESMLEEPLIFNDATYAGGASGLGTSISVDDDLGLARTVAAADFDDVSSIPIHGSDLTGDGFVDFGDLTILLAHWDQSVSAGQGNLIDPLTTPINFQDLTFLLADWTGPGPVGSPEAALGEEPVPEPSGLVLAMVALFGLSFYRRRAV